MRILRPLLFIESGIIVACGVATALSITKTDFESIYRTICSICLISSVLFLANVAAVEFLLKKNPIRVRVVRILGAALVPVVAASLCGWIFSASPGSGEIQRRAYLQFVTWLGILPVILAASLFFKVPAAPPKS